MSYECLLIEEQSFERLRLEYFIRLNVSIALGIQQQCYICDTQKGETCGFLTCVVEEGGDEGAVSEEGVAWRDILKVAFLKHGVFKYHRLHLQIQEPLMTKRKDSLRHLYCLEVFRIPLASTKWPKYKRIKDFTKTRFVNPVVNMKYYT